jgi:hypothetical protein
MHEGPHPGDFPPQPKAQESIGDIASFFRTEIDRITDYDTEGSLGHLVTLAAVVLDKETLKALTTKEEIILKVASILGLSATDKDYLDSLKNQKIDLDILLIDGPVSNPLMDLKHVLTERVLRDEKLSKVFTLLISQ